ncbi:MAG TPA: GTP-binding protein [Burkholderiales bacterium]|nr:GTP-binding protein [Burkholderiales bacterium]
MIVDGRTPVVVVTGFLGSGKTTLINKWIKDLSDTFVIVNEFGDVPVDHHLIENSQERTVALPNGCLCCRLRGDLEETLIGAHMRRRRGDIAGFDRVIVETSGIADPGPVAQTLFSDQALARDFRLGPVVAVVDAADAQSRKAAIEIAQAQIAAADVVILSKVDRSQDLEKTKNEIHGINAAVQCIPAAFGAVDPKLILEISGSDPDFRPAAAHPTDIRSFVLRFAEPVPRALLEQFLSTLVELRGADLLRVKGIVRISAGGFVLVQGVRHVFDRLRPAPGGESALVFISRVQDDEIEGLWQAMSKLKGST